MPVPINHRHNEWERSDEDVVCKCGVTLGPDNTETSEDRTHLMVSWLFHRIQEIESELAFAMDKLEEDDA